MKRILSVCAVTAILLAGCGGQSASEAPELIDAVGVDMDTAEVIKMDLSGVTSYSAQIVPKIEEVSFQASGSVDELKVSVGDHVKKGQLLVTLAGVSGKTKSLQEEIKTLKSSSEDINKQSRYDIDMMEENQKNLKKELGKAKKSADKKRLKNQIAESEADIEIAEERLKQQKELQQLEIRQKEADLAEARKSSKNSKLYSPIDGEVVGTTGGTGYMVQGGNTAIQIADMNSPRIKTPYISGNKLAKASRYVAKVEGREYEVEVEEQVLDRKDIEMGVYPPNTWFDFVKGNLNIAVGKSATLELYTDEVKDALVVPANALFKSGEESYVYVVDGDARTKVVVTTGTTTDAYVQIVTGVKEGDVVYVEG